MHVRKHKLGLTMTDGQGTTIMLAALATVLVLYVVQQERSSSKMALLVGKNKKPKASLGKNLGSATKNSMADCENVDIDSPDFARCSTALGSGRSVVRSEPRGDNMISAFTKDNYSLGNPFAVKLNDGLKPDTNKKLGAQAYPFSQSGAIPKSENSTNTTSSSTKLVANNLGARGQKFEGGKKRARARTSSVEAPARGSSRSSVTLGSTQERGVKFQSLGAAVSPSSLGASSQEMSQFSQKLDDVNKVASNTGGNLNLLHPLN